MPRVCGCLRGSVPNMLSNYKYPLQIRKAKLCARAQFVAFITPPPLETGCEVVTARTPFKYLARALSRACTWS